MIHFFPIFRSVKNFTVDLVIGFLTSASPLIPYTMLPKVCNTLFLFGSLVLPSELKAFKKEKGCLMKKKSPSLADFL